MLISFINSVKSVLKSNGRSSICSTLTAFHSIISEMYA